MGRGDLDALRIGRRERMLQFLLHKPSKKIFVQYEGPLLYDCMHGHIFAVQEPMSTKLKKDCKGITHEEAAEKDPTLIKSLLLAGHSLSKKALRVTAPSAKGESTRGEL